MSGMAATMIESLFQRSLEDLTKGLRTQMIGESKYLAKALDEVKKEIKSTDHNIKAVALQKLTYLHMLQGADMDWAAFHIVEVMSMAKFLHKKFGYLAASESFNENTDVMLLITNLLRKDLSGKNEYETGLALECVSRIATQDLARELTPDLFTLLASGRPFVRKKATVALLRLFNQYPDAIRVSFKRLVEKLGDVDPSVVSAAVSVLCELTLKDPRPYLPLAPEFYKLLVSSPSNWLAIKLVKIFGALAPLEPRLGKKIAEPLAEIIRKTGGKTGAKSLLLECITTVTLGLLEHESLVELCVTKLNEIMREEDRNLKYLGLRCLATFMTAHPWAVAENKEVITQCLSHEDPSIRKSALRLIMGMVSDINVMDTVQVLLKYAHTADSVFCNELVSVLLSTCCRNQYDLISDFSWYVSVLSEMARLPKCDFGEEIGRQLIDIGVRVDSVISDVFKAGRDLVLDSSLLSRPALHGVLSAAAWIVGEYVALGQNPYEVVEGLLQPRVKYLPPSVRSIYLQAVLKIFVFSASKYYRQDFNLPLESRQGVKYSGDGLRVPSVGGNLVDLDQELSSLKLTPAKTTPFSSQNGLDNFCNSEGLTKSCDTAHGPVEDPSRLVGSLEAMVELIIENVFPLVRSVDVDVQERACCIIALLQVWKSVPGLPSIDSDVLYFKEMVKVLDAAFSSKMGPVSVHAQGKVLIPEGLTLDTLDSLGSLYTDEILEGTNETEGYRQWEEGTLFTSNRSNEKAHAEESAVLLAQHRQRHENFYLSSQLHDVIPHGSQDYPQPRMASLDFTGLPSLISADSASLVENSLVGSKLRRPRSRPVVVKLDDEDESKEATTRLKFKDAKDDLISSTIGDVLAGEHRLRSKYPSNSHESERKETGRVRHHRSRSSRSTRHSSRRSEHEGDRGRGHKLDSVREGDSENVVEASETKLMNSHLSQQNEARSSSEEEKVHASVKLPPQNRHKTRRSSRRSSSQDHNNKPHLDYLQ